MAFFKFYILGEKLPMYLNLDTVLTIEPVELHKKKPLSPRNLILFLKGNKGSTTVWFKDSIGFEMAVKAMDKWFRNDQLNGSELFDFTKYQNLMNIKPEDLKQEKS